MGQQQLLLVILVTIIVGIATVVAINTFGSAADSAAQDAVRQDLVTIAASAQGYYMRPEMLGGGGRTFEGISFNNISFAGSIPEDDQGASDPLVAVNENGSYTISGNGAYAATFLVTAVANDTDESELQIRVCADDSELSELNQAAPADCEDD